MRTGIYFNLQTITGKAALCAGFNSWAVKSWNGAQQSRKVNGVLLSESKEAILCMAP